MLCLVVRFYEDADLSLVKALVALEISAIQGVESISLLEEEALRMLLGSPASGKPGKYVAIRCNRVTKLVEVDSICYLEKKNRFFYVHMEDGTDYRCYGKFEEIMPHLPASFCRCHQSYVVNLDMAEQLKGRIFLMKNGATLPVSQKKHSRVKEYMKNFFKETQK